MRVQFDLNEEALSLVHEIQRKTGVPTRAEVLRDAITAFSWMAEKSRRGCRIHSVKEGEVTKVLVMPLLESARARAGHEEKVG